MQRKMMFVMVPLVAMVLAGCTTVTRIGDFTIVSSKNIDLTRGADFKRGTNRVKGEDMVVYNGFTVPGAPNMKTAIDRAIECVPGAVALLDGVISSKVVAYPFWSRSGYVVEGTPLVDLGLLSNSVPTPAVYQPAR
jgi:uncharacterized membrane protein